MEIMQLAHHALQHLQIEVELVMDVWIQQVF